MAVYNKYYKNKKIIHTTLTIQEFNELMQYGYHINEAIINLLNMVKTKRVFININTIVEL